MTLPFFWKNGKLHGCCDVLGRTCCTKYTYTQSCPFLNTVHNECHPRYFSRMVELGYTLSNLRVQEIRLLLLLQGMVVFLLLHRMGMGMLVLMLIMQGMGVLLMLQEMKVLLLLQGMGVQLVAP